MMKTECENSVVFEDAVAFREYIRKLTSECARVFVLHFAGIRTVRPVKPSIAVTKHRRQPCKKEIAQLAVVNEIKIRGVGYDRIDGRVRYWKARAIAVEDERPLPYFSQFLP